MNIIYVGLDNGVTGSIAFVRPNSIPIYFDKTPTKKIAGYQKTKAKKVNVLDLCALHLLFDNIVKEFNGVDNVIFHLLVERPATTKFLATNISAARFDQALYDFRLLTVFNIKFDYIDSKTWQKELLPNNLPAGQTKFFSSECGIDLFPTYKDFIVKHGDADGILIAEYARRNKF